MASCTAPIGGRWGYSYYSNRNLAVQQADLKTLEWVIESGLTVADEPLQATWRPNLVQKRAALDGAFLYVSDAPLARLRVHWAEPSILFDHVALLINLPYLDAGMGFAGACPPLMQRRQHGLKLNLNKWNQKERIWLHLKSPTAGKEGASCASGRGRESNPGPLGSEPSTLANCAICPLNKGNQPKCREEWARQLQTCIEVD